MKTLILKIFSFGLLIALVSCAYTGGKQSMPVNQPGQPQPQAAMKMEREKKDSFAADTTKEEIQGEAKAREFNTESYDRIVENAFLETVKNPLSTFSIDVDTASYANVRRFLNEGSMPYADAVRVEELVNYFTYKYPEPTNSDPFTFNTETAVCPWNADHKIMLIGLQAKRISFQNLPPNNIVFLLDVSGSMGEPNKLPLVKSTLTLLVNELREQDRIAIVVYAGAAGMVLPSTSCKDKKAILAVLENLESGGSTAGGEGIVLAYKIAKEFYNAQGNNRIILCTDGDFNIGASSDSEMERLIEEKRKEGVFLTVLGFGMGNYKDSKMEVLANKGNGNYAYIDDIKEARKVLVTEMGGTLLTIAKDVKIQIEFNPAKVAQYRLIGYENRMLRAEDFTNDLKDAGEMGSGHTVTALYEIVEAKDGGASADLKYTTTTIKDDAKNSKELATIKFRYKKPDGDKSIPIDRIILDSSLSLDKTSENFRWACAVAEWAMLLRKSEYKGKATYDQVVELATGAKGEDQYGYRAEFIDLVKKSKILDIGEKKQTKSGVSAEYAVK